MIKNVVGEHSWPPEVISGLFVDNIDYNGIEYWSDEVIRVNEELKPKKI